jgi:hypothetical protein
MGGGSQDSNLEPYDQVVKEREGVGRSGASALCQLQGCQMSKYHILFATMERKQK